MNMPWSRLAIVAVFSAASSVTVHADIFNFTEATDNATVQVAGPRTGVNGKNFFNLEGSVNGSFSSFGVAEFTLGALGSVNITEITLRFTESNAAFTKPGTIDFWLTSDNATSIQPPSPIGLIFNSAAAARSFPRSSPSAPVHSQPQAM
jgi:hypothetical protein